MNQDKDLLKLNLSLLVAQYGKTRVSEALSAIEDVTLTAIRDEISTFGKRARTRTAQRRPRKSIEEMIREAKPDSPQAESIIERLARAYESKEFLPELREVKRFLDSRSISPTKLRSRADALPAVVGVLAQCGLEELHSLDRRRRTQGSDLGVITDQILGRTDNRL